MYRIEYNRFFMRDFVLICDNLRIIMHSVTPWKPMAFKRSAVQSRLSPPNQYNPNLYPIGNGFGFIVYIEEIEDW